MSMVIAEHLHKTFGRFVAVRDASFSIDKGEIVGFLGPNGAGKTTTMKMITGYLPPTAGTASIAGFDVLKNPLEARRHMGYMPENVPLYDDMRVYEYLEYRARLKGICGSSVRQQIAFVIDRCGLEPKRKNMISTLSKGYRQRVGLADALLGNPDLLILDEPTAVLTPQETEKLFAHPLHPYTRALLSAIPMPDPESEKKKVLEVYDRSCHHYETDKPVWTEIEEGHFIMANQEELAAYRQKLAQ